MLLILIIVLSESLSIIQSSSLTNSMKYLAASSIAKIDLYKLKIYQTVSPHMITAPTF